MVLDHIHLQSSTTRIILAFLLSVFVISFWQQIVDVFIYFLSHPCMSPVPQLPWPKACPLTMSPQNRQIPSLAIGGLLISNDLHGQN